MMDSLLDLLKANPFTAFLTALATAVIGWFSVRTQKAPDIQATLNTGVAQVIGHYNTVLESARAEIQNLRSEVAELRRTIEAQNERLELQSDEIGNLNDHIEALTVELVRAGINPPPRRRSGLAPMLATSV